jgi:hypothetical protein
MMTTIFTSDRVHVRSNAYAAAREKAERIAAQQRIAGIHAHCRWADDYNDHSATGRFIVTSR